MKNQMSIRQLNQIAAATGERIFYAPANSLQRILSPIEPVAYNAGIYGWNCDIYHPGSGLWIVTGYRNMTGDPMPEWAGLFESQAAQMNLEERERHLEHFCNALLQRG